MPRQSREPIRDPEADSPLRQVMELFEVAELMMRANLRRRHPEENAEQIEDRLRHWLVDRPWPERVVRDSANSQDITGGAR